jgi:hypothetical protein
MNFLNKINYKGGIKMNIIGTKIEKDIKFEIEFKNIIDCLKQEALQVKFDKLGDCSLIEDGKKVVINGLVNDKWEEITITNYYKISKLKAVLELEYVWYTNNIDK